MILTPWAAAQEFTVEAKHPAPRTSTPFPSTQNDRPHRAGQHFLLPSVMSELLQRHRAHKRALGRAGCGLP